MLYSSSLQHIPAQQTGIKTIYLGNVIQVRIFQIWKLFLILGIWCLQQECAGPVFYNPNSKQTGCSVKHYLFVPKQYNHGCIHNTGKSEKAKRQLKLPQTIFISTALITILFYKVEPKVFAKM